MCCNMPLAAVAGAFPSNFRFCQVFILPPCSAQGTYATSECLVRSSRSCQFLVTFPIRQGYTTLRTDYSSFHHLHVIERGTRTKFKGSWFWALPHVGLL